MIATNIRKEDIQRATVDILVERLPNSVRIRKVRELLERDTRLGASPEEIDRAFAELESEGVIKLSDRDNSGVSPAVRLELRRRESMELASPPDAPIKGEYQVGDTSVVRLLNYDKLSAEDINEITEALKDYIDRIDKTFDERVQQKTTEIYKQMIGIFGVFVSIFSIIIISTEKMLRFSPEVLAQDWSTLLGKSAVLFLPVGIVIGGLVYLVSRRVKK